MGKAKTSFKDSRKAKHSLDANRGEAKPHMRTAATVRRLKMYKERAVRDHKGRLIYQSLQSSEVPKARIQPDRRWFGNTRVIGQKQLERFREEMASHVNDNYTVLLREKKLPLSLLEDPDKAAQKGGKGARADLLAVEPFSDTFGKGAQRKRPKLRAEDYSEMVQKAEEQQENYDGRGFDTADRSRDAAWDEAAKANREPLFDKGQSRRIWGELYKVLDSSDVIVEVLDARDPEGTRCRFLENHIKRNARHKHLLLLLNKCDLVPAWVTKRWLHHLSREFPVLAMHASLTNPFGKAALLSVLRQFARLRQDKPAISVGFVGYPNVGKSSVINCLKAKAVCKAAPVPGETKVWQYITLMKRVFLIDCPGVVYNKTKDTEVDAVLKGVVRVENLENADAFVPFVVDRVKPEYLRRAYQIPRWADAEDFLAQLATRSGKLLKGGEPDLVTAAKMVLYDWQRGRIPYFTLPPGHEGAAPEEKGAEEEGAAQGDDGGKGEGEGGGGGDDGVGHESGGGMAAPAGLADAEAAASLEGPQAGLAATAINEELVRVSRRQLRLRLPAQQGYFDEADLQEPGAGAEGSDEGSESEGEEFSGTEGDDSSDESAGTGGDDSGAGDSDEEASDEEEGAKGKGGGERGSGGGGGDREGDAGKAGEESSEDEDDAALTWEALMRDMAGGAEVAEGLLRDAKRGGGRADGRQGGKSEAAGGSRRGQGRNAANAEVAGAPGGKSGKGRGAKGEGAGAGASAKSAKGAGAAGGAGRVGKASRPEPKEASGRATTTKRTGVGSKGVVKARGKKR